MKPHKQPLTKRNLIDYCERFASLNVSNTKKRGNAQYKPILLLSVIDLIGQGIIDENKIFVSDELIDTFDKYWEILGAEYKGGLHYPFFHLISEGFWNIKFKPEFNGLQPKTTNKLKQAVEYATLDNELYEIIKDDKSRQELINTLISIWFKSVQKDIKEVLKINQVFQDQKLQQFQINVDDNYKVIVANNFEEISPNARCIADFQGEQILLPESSQYFPRLEAIQWHRQNIFRNS